MTFHAVDVAIAVQFQIASSLVLVVKSRVYVHVV